MAKQRTKKAKRVNAPGQGRKPLTGDEAPGAPVLVRPSKAIEKRVDKWRGVQEGKPSRATAYRLVMLDRITADGF